MPSAVPGHPSHWLPRPRSAWLAHSGALWGPWRDWAGRGRPRGSWVGLAPREVCGARKATGAGPAGTPEEVRQACGGRGLIGWGKRFAPTCQQSARGFRVHRADSSLCFSAWGRGTQMGCGGVTQSPGVQPAQSPVSALEEPGPAAWGPRGWEEGSGGPSALALALPGPHPGWRPHPETGLDLRHSPAQPCARQARAKATQTRAPRGPQASSARCASLGPALLGVESASALQLHRLMGTVCHCGSGGRAPCV